MLRNDALVELDLTWDAEVVVSILGDETGLDLEASVAKTGGECV
jgi:hypothetical protein